MHLPRGQAAPRLAEKHRAAISARRRCEQFLSQRVVAPQCRHRHSADGHDALFAPFSQYPRPLGDQIQIRQVAPLQLAEAHAGGVKELHDRQVAHCVEAAIFAACLRVAEYRLHLLPGEKAGQRPVHLGCTDQPRRVVVHLLLHVHEAVKGADR